MRLIAVALCVSMVGCVAECPAAPSVTASRDYVDRKTELKPVTNGSEVVGYTLGTQSNVLASAESLKGLADTVASNRLAIGAVETNLAAHVSDTNNPHGVTAEQIHALELVQDEFGEWTAATIGGDRTGAVGPSSLAHGYGVTASGSNSHAEGMSTTASGFNSHAEGLHTTASGPTSHASGAFAVASNDYAYVWGATGTSPFDTYGSHGEGTYNISPMGGASGFYIGETNLQTFLDAKASSGDVDSKIASATNAMEAAGTARQIVRANETNGYWNTTVYKAWNAAYADEATLAAQAGTADEVQWTGVKNPPTTLLGYGITDAARNSDVVAISATLDDHISDESNPHGVTAEQIHALGFVQDEFGERTAVTIGSRSGDVGPKSIVNGDDATASGGYSHAEGEGTTASGGYSHAEGGGTTASGEYSHAEGGGTTASGHGSHAGGTGAVASNTYSYAWSGVDNGEYGSHGEGTYNISPKGGASGFYIGETNLQTFLDAKASSGDVDSKIASATNDPTIVRGSKIGPTDVWDIKVVSSEIAANADHVPWTGIGFTPTTLAGYGITDAVPSSRKVNGKPLTSDITLSASDLGAATTNDLAAATTNVVHGDYSDADRSAFPNGIGFKAGDGSDKGYVGLRLRNLEARGLEVIGSREVTTPAGQTFVQPYTLFQVTDTRIRFPKDYIGDSVSDSDFTSIDWYDFSKANHVLDIMPASYSANYEGYPISGKAFNEYFWSLNDLPAKAKASITVHAASNLVGVAGAPMMASDIIGEAVKDSVLSVTSDVPVYASSSSSTWTSDWPADDSAQPSQPQWADGQWSVYLVEGGETLPGTYSVEGDSDATSITIDIAGFSTVFERTPSSTVVGYVNAHGFARLNDVTNAVNRLDARLDEIESATNELGKAIGMKQDKLTGDSEIAVSSVEVDRVVVGTSGSSGGIIISSKLPGTGSGPLARVATDKGITGTDEVSGMIQSAVSGNPTFQEATNIVKAAIQGIGAPSLDGYDLYVDPVNGDDTLGGTTAATAKRTIDAAYSLVTNHDARICLMPGTHQSPSGDWSTKNKFPAYRVRFTAPYGPERTRLDGGGVRCLAGCSDTFTSVDGCTLSGFVVPNVNWIAFFGISFTNCVFEGDLYQSSFSSRTPFDSCLFADCQMDVARTVSSGYTNMNGSAAFFSGCEAYDSRFIVANTNDNSRGVFSSGSVFRNCYIWAENASKFAVYYTSVLGNAAAFRDSTLICPSAITNDGSVAASGCLIGIGTNGSEYAWGRATNSVLTDAATLSASLGGDLRPAVTNWKYRFLGYGSEGDRALRDSMLSSANVAIIDSEAFSNNVARLTSPKEPSSEVAIRYAGNGTGIIVSIAEGGTLGCVLDGWPNLQSQTALITLGSGAEVDSRVKLIGYGSWPTEKFLASCIRVGESVYVNAITVVAE